MKTKNIVLLGPPNSGKTTLYNQLTGSNYNTVNYPGATVEYSKGSLKKNECQNDSFFEQFKFNLFDTPGVVSIVPRTDDEKVALSVIGKLNALEKNANTHPDLIILTIDVTQLARHLSLFKQLKDTRLPFIVALTMNDIAAKEKSEINFDKLESLISQPVIEVNGLTGTGLCELYAAIESFMPPKPFVTDIPVETSEEEITKTFNWVDNVIAELDIPNNNRPTKISFLDKLTLNPIGGLLAFIIIMSGLFTCVFSLAAPLMDIVDGIFGYIGELAANNLNDSWYSSLIVDGIIAGVGAVFVFVPQIAVLFLLLSLLEDSGYLARGAMLVDRLLKMIGLNGNSFVPLLSGNACAIPAAMAARTIPGKKEKFLTLLVIPLMNCSARLPVWGLLLAFLIPQDNALVGGLALTAIYLASLIMASVVALIGGYLLKLEKSPTGFQIEIPKWRKPSVKNAILNTYNKTMSYVKRAGVVIIVVSIVFWVIMNLPSADNSVAMYLGKVIEPLLKPMGLDWKVGVALIAAFAAREVFVSALAVIYSISNFEENTDGLILAMRDSTFTGTTDPVFTTSSVLGLIIFFMIALQCMTTVAVMRKEVSDKFAWNQMIAFVLLAYVLSVIVVQGMRLIGYN